MQIKVNVYFAPITDPDVETGYNRLDPKYHIGENIVKKDGDPVKPLGTKILKKGEYLLTYEAVGSAQFQWLANFKLEYPADWKNRVKTPVIISDPIGEFTGKSIVTITSETVGTSYYTTDGTTPNVSSMEYKGPFNITETTNIKAIAIKDGMPNSASATAVIIKKAVSDGYMDLLNVLDTKNSTPLIDGEIGDGVWSMTPMDKKVGDSKDIASFGMRWDNDNLYIGIKIENLPNPMGDGSQREIGNCISLYFDPTMHRSSTLSGNKGDRQIGIGHIK